MNLRDFKKDVDFIVGEFVDDCALFLSVNTGKATEKVEAVIDEAVELYNSLKDRANEKVEGKKSKYFNTLRKEMLEKTDALYEKLSGIIAHKED